jgi:GNAT superfamily N-acetyltransferase
MLHRMGAPLVIRVADERDIPAMAAIRAREWESLEYWQERLGGYLRGTHNPQQALPERACWVAVDGDHVVGFVAGHRTRRFECDGELQWINVLPEFRGRGVADQLMGVVLSWFRQNEMNRICVNVTSENAGARRLYSKHGAVALKAGWMEWGDLSQVTLFSKSRNET